MGTDTLDLQSDEPDAVLERHLETEVLTKNDEVVEKLVERLETLQGKSIVVGDKSGEWRLYQKAGPKGKN